MLLTGKTTVATALEERLKSVGALGRQISMLDGDVVRQLVSSGLGFSKEDRELNIKRIGSVLWVRCALYCLRVLQSILSAFVSTIELHFETSNHDRWLVCDAFPPENIHESHVMCNGWLRGMLRRYTRFERLDVFKTCQQSLSGNRRDIFSIFERNFVFLPVYLHATT